MLKPFIKLFSRKCLILRLSTSWIVKMYFIVINAFYNHIMASWIIFDFRSWIKKNFLWRPSKYNNFFHTHLLLDYINWAIHYLATETKFLKDSLNIYQGTSLIIEFVISKPFVQILRVDSLPIDLFLTHVQTISNARD